MSTKTKTPAKPVEIPPEVETPPAPTTVEEVVNEPKQVTAFGRKYQIQRFNVGQLIRALPHIAPLSYLAQSAGKIDATQMAVQVLNIGGEPALGLVSVAISEPVEWIEEQDDVIGGFDLLVEVIEKNARYFFDPANLERLKEIAGRLQSITLKHGGATSTP